MKQNHSLFKWRHFEPTVILLCVRWYCRYQLSYRDLEEMMQERGLILDHTTVFRWVQKYAPEINKRIRPHLKMSGTSYRLDETYVKVGTQWKYLYRAMRVSDELCKRVSVQCRHSPFKDDRECLHRTAPVLNRHRPLFRDIAQG